MKHVLSSHFGELMKADGDQVLAYFKAAQDRKATVLQDIQKSRVPDVASLLQKMQQDGKEDVSAR